MDLNNAIRQRAASLAERIDRELAQPFLEAVIAANPEVRGHAVEVRRGLDTDPPTMMWTFNLSGGEFPPSLARLRPADAVELHEHNRSWAYALFGGLPSNVRSLARFGRQGDGQLYVNDYDPELDDEQLFSRFQEGFAAYRTHIGI
jgi:hypothetical protein